MAVARRGREVADVAVLFEDLTSVSGYAIPSATFTGEATTRFAAPAGYALWMNAGEVGAGSTLSWTADHGDESVYVEQGLVEIDGRRCGPGGTVIVERGVPARLSFLEDSAVAHFGSYEIAPVEGPARPPSVHVLDAPLSYKGTTGFFIDGNCESCAISFVRVSGEEAHVGRAHSHTADEIMYVTKGTIRTGRVQLRPGMALAIPADRIYSFRTDEPWEFVNYRDRPSQLIWARETT
jgi:quercetin dioxygenase-like cupin family protein